MGFAECMLPQAYLHEEVVPCDASFWGELFTMVPAPCSAGIDTIAVLAAVAGAFY